ncbi:DUF2065 domain-containing protein [Thiomicrospira microaerophila]|uniref:DUF2065 domain-containing protein n=1 Tax=Thiomicrospira microaerophila TaxID=406020 RepID=UPI00200F8DC6|nr:DUF2065 domain-containing protein [Thiomicrospira microaerophila]UQB41659.1 DUF2065 domain-containing protein [Thiomicrospira microaerophila]
MLEAALITAIALVFIFEGLLPFLFPKFWQRIMLRAAQLPENHLRLTGLGSVLIGLIILWLWA